jgi:hypothetical protein
MAESNSLINPFKSLLNTLNVRDSLCLVYTDHSNFIAGLFANLFQYASKGHYVTTYNRMERDRKLGERGITLENDVK